MQRLEIQKIIAHIKTIPEVISAIWENIFWGLPKSEKNEDYLCLTEVTESQDEVWAFSRVEFRFIACNDKTNWNHLYDIERAITNAISNKWMVDFNWFKAYKVKIDLNVFSWYDEKQRKIYVRDYIFYYTN